MSKHSELLKDARELALIFEVKVKLDRPRKMGVGFDHKCAMQFHILANLIEHQDKVITEVQSTARRRETTIRSVLKECDAFNTELVAACKTCDEAITAMIDQTGSLLVRWHNLTVARDLASRVATLAKPEAPDDHATTLRKLAECAEQPEPAVEVAMRVRGALRQGFLWEFFCGGIWVKPNFCDRERYYAPTPRLAHDQARKAGCSWLAALSDQLGVPLVAVWEEGE